MSSVSLVGSSANASSPAPSYWIPTVNNPPQQKSAVGLGAASLTLSLLFLFGLGSLLGVIFGTMGIRRAKSSGTSEGRGLSVAGVVIGSIGLVVMVMITVVPYFVFTNQKESGYHSAVKADLRNAAFAQETYLTNTGAYTDNIRDLPDLGFTPSSSSNYAAGTSVQIVSAEGNESYCLQATSTSGKTFSYHSAEGLAEGSCPTG